MDGVQGSLHSGYTFLHTLPRIVLPALQDALFHLYLRRPITDGDFRSHLQTAANCC